MDKFISQVWRAARIGGVAFAAQYATYGVTHPKQGYIAGGIAAVEVIYRLLVPAAEQSRLAKLVSSVEAIVAQAEAQPVATPKVATPLPTAVPKA